jgi:hypothetical protein
MIAWLISDNNQNHQHAQTLPDHDHEHGTSSETFPHAALTVKMA